MFSSFTTTIGSHYIYEEVVGFSPLWFPRGKFFLSLVFYFFHVILLVNYSKIIMLA